MPQKKSIGNIRLNYFIIAVLVILGFAIFYFFYYTKRSEQWINVRLTLLRSDKYYSAAPYNWLPYWHSRSISEGDTETSPVGGIDAKVIKIDTIEGRTYGGFTYLTLKMKIIRDKSTGVSLFKNKPLGVGNTLEIDLPRTHIIGLITAVDLPDEKKLYRTLTLNVRAKQLKPWIADALTVGSVIKNRNGDILVKLLDKKTQPAKILVSDILIPPILLRDVDSVDAYLTIQIQAKKVDNTYYFFEQQKVKVGEELFLPFPETYIEPAEVISILSEDK